MEKHVERKPLFFTETRRKQLESYLSGFTFLRSLKWNAKKSFVTFLIGSLPFKVVTAPTRSVDMTKIVYFSDRPRWGWIINAYAFHLSCQSIIKAIIIIFDLMENYDTMETYKRMKEIVNRNNLNPTTLKHKCFEVNGGLVLDIHDSETEKCNLMVKELTDKTIEELSMKSDGYGATYYIIKTMAWAVIADTLCGLGPQDNCYNMWSPLRNKYPVEY